MTVLDTNVISELMRPQPASQIVGWLDRQNAAETFITAITVAEILYGIERMADGRRRRSLGSTAVTMFEEEFANRILPFDGDAAAIYARQAAAAERAGRSVQFADVQIAAICIKYRARLASRNVKDFHATDVTLINPWVNVSG